MDFFFELRIAGPCGYKTQTQTVDFGEQERMMMTALEPFFLLCLGKLEISFFGELKQSKCLSCQSHGVLASPLLGRGLVLGLVGFVEVCNFGNERIVGICITEQRADGEQHF